MLRLVAACALLAGASGVQAQSIEPRAFSNAPVGMNFLVQGLAHTKRGLSSSASLPLENPELETSSAVIAYARTLDLWGKSGKFDLILPYTVLSGSADYKGSLIERNVSGAGDATVRMSMNFYGAPALALPAFKSYEQDLIMGASLQFLLPTGQYDDTRLINIGANRWYIKPEFGVSQALGPLTLEGAAAVTAYSNNKEFFNESQRSQAPLYSLRAHAIYNFPRGIWSSVDATYFAGGRTSVNGIQGVDRQQNWRVGATLAFPIDLQNSIKLFASRGVSDRTGNSFDLLGLAWQYRWGAGL